MREKLGEIGGFSACPHTDQVQNNWDFAKTRCIVNNNVIILIGKLSLSLILGFSSNFFQQRFLY